MVDVRRLSVKHLRKSTLLGLGTQMRDELNAIRGQPLRQSAALLVPDRRYYYRHDPEFKEPHRRGEILVAAMMNAFLEVWTRLTLGDGESQRKRCTASGWPRKAAEPPITC